MDWFIWVILSGTSRSVLSSHKKYQQYHFLFQAKTNYTIWGSGRDGQAKEYYTIEAILFFLENIELTHPQYIKAAIEKFGSNDKNVSRPDRKDLLAFLQGQAPTSMSIDRNAQVELGRPRPRSDMGRNQDPMDIDFDTSKVEPSERLRNILDKVCFLTFSFSSRFLAIWSCDYKR